MTLQASILVVDDDPQIREVVRFALAREGFRVAEAGNGRDALAAFERERADLVVLDSLMPEMDGTDVCRAIRSIHSQLEDEHAPRAPSSPDSRARAGPGYQRRRPAG